MIIRSRYGKAGANEMMEEETIQSKLTEETESKRVDPKNQLNDLTGKEWLKFLKSWYVFDALHSDLEEERKVTQDTRDHPATFSPTMISDYVKFFTKRGMKVLDPFVGIGSTLVACERTGRLGYGIELNHRYADITKKRVSKRQKVIVGDSTRLSELGLPKMDFCITSPPYWSMLHKIDVNQKMRIDKGLSTKYSESRSDLGNIVDYEQFMTKLVDVFTQVHSLLIPGKYLVIIAQNVIDRHVMIPFAWDLAIRLSKIYILKKEKIWCQDHKNLYPFGYPYSWVSNTHHHYALIFQKQNGKQYEMEVPPNGKDSLHSRFLTLMSV
jgi:DNA modification methylase